MKTRMIIVSVLLSIVMHGYSQDVNVPKSVLANFEERFPDAKDVAWEQSKNNYNAQFTYIVKHVSVFSENGNWIRTIVTISEDELPETIIGYIEENYFDVDIQQVQSIENNVGDKTYKVIFYEDEVKISLTFDADGNIN